MRLSASGGAIRSRPKQRSGGNICRRRQPPAATTSSRKEEATPNTLPHFQRRQSSDGRTRSDQPNHLPPKVAAAARPHICQGRRRIPKPLPRDQHQRRGRPAEAISPKNLPQDQRPEPEATKTAAKSAEAIPEARQDQDSTSGGAIPATTAQRQPPEEQAQQRGQYLPNNLPQEQRREICRGRRRNFGKMILNYKQ